jgi:predicted nucleic acid-binding protein
MERLIFVDSNIWCYYFDRSAQEHNIVSDKLEKALEDRVAINTVIEMEVAHYLIKNLGLEGKSKMYTFLSYPMGPTRLQLASIHFLNAAKFNQWRLRISSPRTTRLKITASYVLSSAVN